MKINRNQRTKSIKFSNSINNNLNSLKEQLQVSFKFHHLQLDSSPIDGLQLSNLQEKSIQENLKLLESLLSEWNKNQISTMLLYNKLIARSESIKYKSHRAFSHTIFHYRLWPLLTYFLQIKLNYPIIMSQNSKVVDVWYQFILCEQKLLFDRVLSSNLIEKQILGQWFKKQCLENLFTTYFIDKKSYTNLLMQVLKLGIAFIFLYSIKILKKMSDWQKQEENLVQYEQRQKIKSIKQSYIDRFLQD